MGIPNRIRILASMTLAISLVSLPVAIFSLSARAAEQNLDRHIGEGLPVTTSFQIRIFDQNGQEIPAKKSYLEFSMGVELQCSYKNENGKFSDFMDCENSDEYSVAGGDNNNPLTRIFPEIRLNEDGKTKWKLSIRVGIEGQQGKDYISTNSQDWTTIITRASDLLNLKLEENLKELQLLVIPEARVRLTTRSGRPIEAWLDQQGFNGMHFDYQIVAGQKTRFPVGDGNPYRRAGDSFKSFKTENIIAKQMYLVPKNQLKAYVPKGQAIIDGVKGLVPVNADLREDIVPPATRVEVDLLAAGGLISLELDDCLYSSKYVRCQRSNLCERAALNSLVFMGLSKAAPDVKEGVDYCHQKFNSQTLPSTVQKFLTKINQVHERIGQIFKSDVATLFGEGFNLFVVGTRLGALTSAFASNGNLSIGVYPQWKIDEEVLSVYIHELGHFLLSEEMKTGIPDHFKKLANNSLFTETFADTLTLNFGDTVFGDTALKRCEPRRVTHHQGYNYSRGYFDSTYARRTIGLCCQRLEKAGIRDSYTENICRTLKENQRIREAFSSEVIGLFDRSSLEQDNFFATNKPAIDPHQIGLPFNSWLLSITTDQLYKGRSLHFDNMNKISPEALIAKVNCKVVAENGKTYSESRAYSSPQNYFGALLDNLKKDLDEEKYKGIVASWQKKKLNIGIQFSEASAMRELSSNLCQELKAKAPELGCSYDMLQGTCEACKVSCERE